MKTKRQSLEIFFTQERVELTRSFDDINTSLHNGKIFNAHFTLYDLFVFHRVSFHLFYTKHLGLSTSICSW